jgi:amidase
VRGLRIGIDRALIAAGADVDMVRATEEAATELTRMGALMHDVTFPSPDAVVRDARSLCGVEAAVAHEATYPSRAAEYGPVLSDLLETGRSLDESGPSHCRDCNFQTGAYGSDRGGRARAHGLRSAGRRA